MPTLRAGSGWGRCLGGSMLTTPRLVVAVALGLRAAQLAKGIEEKHSGQLSVQECYFQTCSVQLFCALCPIISTWTKH